MNINIKITLLLISLVFVVSCTTISQFDQHSYNSATSIKVEALSLMDSAINTYASQQTQINYVSTQINKAYEYEKNRPKNTITTAMWRKLKDTTGHLFGGFVTRWKNEQTLKPVFIQDAKPLIDSAFDQIAQLESGKIKPGQVSNQ